MQRESYLRITSIIASALLLALIQAAVLPQPTQAQFWKEIKEKAKQVVTQKALEKADEQFGHIMTMAVRDGRFIAVLAPWAASDGYGTADYVTISGMAFFIPAGDEFSLLLCEDAGGQGWSTRLTLRGDQAAAIPQDSTEYDLASSLVAMDVEDTYARVESNAQGAISLKSVSEDLWVGTARLTLPRVFLTEESDAQSVQVAATFRARPQAQGSGHAACSSADTDDATTRRGRQ